MSSATSKALKDLQGNRKHWEEYTFLWDQAFNENKTDGEIDDILSLMGEDRHSLARSNNIADYLLSDPKVKSRLDGMESHPLKSHSSFAPTSTSTGGQSHQTETGYTPPTDITRSHGERSDPFKGLATRLRSKASAWVAPSSSGGYSRLDESKLEPDLSALERGPDLDRSGAQPSNDAKTKWD
ncbi:hypothetical protein I317_01343 [Kwoniella heveanensis CBS 569]|nr:hypothetical protein I317_01343 [Kwoniella heveanensis CBS 569]